MIPAARITLDGKEVMTRPGPNTEALISLTVTDEAGTHADVVEVEVPGAGFAAPRLGGEIQVWLGYEPRPVYMGRYLIDAWTKSGPPTTLRIVAKAADMAGAIKSQRTRSHHDTTLGAIVRKIASEHNLQPAIDEALATHTISHLDQLAESNMNLLTRLAGRYGATFKVADGRLIFTEVASPSLPNGEPKPMIILTPGDVSDWSVVYDQRGGFGSVITSYNDRDAGKRRYAKVGTEGPEFRDKRLYSNQVEALAAAKATFARLDRSRHTAELTGPGIPSLFAEAIVRLSEFGADVDGDYVVSTVRHELSSSGFITNASLMSVGSGAR